MNENESLIKYRRTIKGNGFTVNSWDRVEEYLGDKGSRGRGMLEQEGGNVGIGRGGDSSAVATP